MFKKWDGTTQTATSEDNGQKPVESVRPERPAPVTKGGSVNTILKGSKLTGDINVTCDLELSGDVEGNITSDQKSNITIQGTCKGNITTSQGNVAINGELKQGNIIAGGEVTITGKFSGGEVKAEGKIYVNGEFDGKLDGKEIEIGPQARGKGEILYEEAISIARGARIEGQISRGQKEPKDVKTEKVVETKQPPKEKPEKT